VDQDFYKQYAEDSPLLTGTIQQVYTIPQTVQVAGSSQSQEIQTPTYSCKIVLDDGRQISNVTWMNPLITPSGSGMYVVPKEGTKVVVCFTKKGQPIILGYLTPTSITGDFSLGRQPMPGGSMVIETDYGNKILVQEGGIIQIQSTPVCKRTYIPGQDMIRDFCRNYFLTTSGGQMSWTESRDGKRLTKFIIDTFTQAGQKGDEARLQLGTHDMNDPDPSTLPAKIFSLLLGPNTEILIDAKGNWRIKNNQPSGPPGDIQIDSDGNFVINNGKDVTIDTQTGAITMTAGSGTQIQMMPSGDINITSPTKIKITAPQVEIDAAEQVTISSPFVQIAAPGFPAGRALVDTVLVNDPTDGVLSGYIVDGSDQVLIG
jgi:hypothetical protein